MSEMPALSMVEAWLQPLPNPDEPCGKDLEHDNQFLELNQAALGKPETQFGPGEAPDWRKVLELSEALMEQTRDLRVALLWLRAGVNLHGFAALSAGLRLVEGQMQNFWSDLHPLPDPDDGDQYARVNALAVLPEMDGLLGDLRRCVLVRLRGAGELQLRSVSIALGLMAAGPEEHTYSGDQITQMLASAQEQEPDFRAMVTDALADLQALAKSTNEKLGVENAPNMRPLLDLIKGLDGLLPEPEDAVAGAPDEAAAQGGAGFVTKASLGSVSSRQDALRAIDLVCDYLERTEPTNPAQMLLRRARKLVDLNFLQLIKELAPEGLNEAARTMGVDPSEFNNSYDGT